ncbi:MAG: ABC transporter substrate-binding protein [Alphaproteobacteria bacterium]|nr:MAG: ABC transporter substrate-binding protein [Alphaproteobacteria bacterium]
MRIKLAENFRAVFYAPFYAAYALGFYAREGVELELLPSPAPAAAASALLDGTIDLTWGGPMRVMKARDEKADSPLVCFCEVVARDPFFLVGRADPSTFQLADLSRMRLATVSEVPTPWLCLQHDVRKLSVDPDRIDRVADRTMASNLEALRHKGVDVAQMFEPYVSTALRDDLGKILYAASTRGPTVYTTFLATRSGIERQRDALLAMSRAIVCMQDWLAGHSAEELAQASTDFYPHVPPDILVRSLARYRNAELWSRTTKVSRQGFARLAESLLSGGFISHLPQYDDCVDQTLC